MEKIMNNKELTYAGCGACEICGEVDPCADCSGEGLTANLHNGLLKEVNQMLMKIMINHPYFEARMVADLNHKVCEKIQEERGAK
jgi:hypothetical protein